MKKILVLSDSHGTMRYMEQAIDRVCPNLVIHLGDHQSDAEELRREYPNIPIIYVSGNCDGYFGRQDTISTVIDDIPVLLTHGHRYGVKNGYTRLEYAAMEQQVKLVLFGHTHIPYCAELGGILYLNPGACNGYSTPSCGIVEIENGKLVCYNQKILMEDGEKI